MTNNLAYRIDFDAAARASARVMIMRETARDEAIATIRSIERRLQEAIAGDTLRGMNTISPPWAAPAFRGARVHLDKDYGIRSDLPKDGRQALAIDEDGRLMVAVIADRVVSTRAADDDDLKAQDLEPFVRTVQLLLERHIHRAEKTTASYERVSDLSKRLSSAVGFDF